MNGKCNPQRLTRMLPALLCLCFCFTAGTSNAQVEAQSSSALIKPASKFTALRVFYVNRRVAPVPDTYLPKDPMPLLQELGIERLPRLFGLRVPEVLGMNGIASEYNFSFDTVQNPFQLAATASWQKTDAPVLIIGMVQAAGRNNKRGMSTQVFVLIQAELIDFRTRQRFWTGRFENLVTKAAGTVSGFDEPYVDLMLKTMLEQLTKDGMIELPDGVAKTPVPAPAQAPAEPAGNS